MSEYSQNRKVNRILDANLNRAKEGLRVCEEVARFVLDNPKLTSRLKAARHKIDRLARSLASSPELLKMRKSLSDVGRNNSAGELKRENVDDIFRANIQRCKESMRVLEEFSKLSDLKAALKFKALRYEIYDIEKVIFKNLS